MARLHLEAYKVKKLFCLDFETQKICFRPKYPPTPCGFSILEPGRKPRYWAWAHPEGNNCTKDQAENELKRLFQIYNGAIAHHLKFEWDILETFFTKVKLPPITECHDTLLLAFLDDPHSRQLGLKILSVKFLDREPDERDALKDWIIENVPDAKRAKTQWGAYISLAPGDLVAHYCNADTDMTAGIYKVLYKNILESGMSEAYMRELKLIPILLENERRGLHVDLPALERDVPIYEIALTKLDIWIRKYLEAPADLNIDSDKQFADALESSGMVKDWIYTAPDKNGKGGGQRSTNKAALSEMLEDRLLLAALEYRGALATFTRTFLTAWRDVARETNGWIYTSWNSTAQEEGGGTRTGRLSSSKPANFTNIPSGERYEELSTKLAASGLFKKLKFLPALPKCRTYIIADDSKSVILGRDYSQQEVRVLAHFEDAGLRKAYIKDPRMDAYVYAMGEILRTTGRNVTRKQTKVLVLAVLYGLGSGKLAERLGCTVLEAKSFKETFFGVFPGVRELTKNIQGMFKRREPIRTQGGRLYYCEPSRVINGVLRDFAYKGINVLVQGSSADVTKEAIIRYSEAKKDSRFLLTVHDENSICCPRKAAKAEMEILKEAMEGVPLDVPLTSDGYIGDNWGDLKEFG